MSNFVTYCFRRLIGAVMVLYVSALARFRTRETGLEHTNCLEWALRQMQQHGGAVIIVPSQSYDLLPHAVYVARGQLPLICGKAFDPGPTRVWGLRALRRSPAFPGRVVDLMVGQGVQAPGEK
jgi:hypothetical protein